VTESEGLLERATLIGARLAPQLESLRADGLVADVRGLGALWAVGVPDGVDPVAVRDRVLELGVVVRPIAPSTLAICPPLVIGDDDLDAVPAALRTVLAA